jgi:hypothetical protein
LTRPDLRIPWFSRRIGCLAILLFLTACTAVAAETAIPPSPTAPSPASKPAFAGGVRNIAGISAFTPFPTDEGTPTPSLTQTPTDTPSPSPSATGTQETPSPSAGKSPPPGTPAGSSVACDNILYPLAAGRWWKYEIVRPDAIAIAEASVLAVEGNTASIDLLDQSRGTHTTFAVSCADGALAGFTAAEIGFLYFPSGTSLIIHTVSGLLAPDGNELESADWDFAWNTDLLASGRMIVPDPSLGDVELVFQDDPLHIDWRTAGAGAAAFESVTVPAGTFPQALKVFADARFDLAVKANVGGQNQLLPAVLELSSSLWYQPNVGLVKQVFTSSQILFSGYSCPLNIAAPMGLSAFSFPH